MDSRNRGSGGAGGYGRGRGRGRGSGVGRGGNYQSQYVSQGGDYCQGGDRGRGRGGYENQDNVYVARGRGSGGRRGGGGRGGNYENRYVQSQGGRGGDYYQSGGRGRGRDGGTYMGGYNNRPPSPGSHDAGPSYTMPQQFHQSGGLEPARRGAWTGRPWGRRTPSSPSSSTGQPQSVTLPQSQNQRAPESSPDPVKLIQSLDISEQKSPSSEVESDNKLVPVRRPDKGTLAISSVRLLANHFRIQFNPAATIIHYDVDVKRVTPHGNEPLKRSIPKSDMHLIREKLFSDDPERFPINMAAYDGEKDIFSAVQLPTGQFRVHLPDGEDGNGRSYIFTIKEVNQLKLSKLKDYLCANISCIPRDVLQGMDLVMKENPLRYRIPVGRSFYDNDDRRKVDLGRGVAAYTGFQQSLKPTSQGLALCLDYSVLAFRKPLPVIQFLTENVNGFRGPNDVINLRRQVIRALKGLKVKVTHRTTKQKYTISGLSEKNTCDLGFELLDPEGQAPPRKITVVDYFREKYKKEILRQHIPCLDLGKPNKANYVPMEFCILVEGQIYPKENLENHAAKLLKKISLVPPAERKNTICDMVVANDGPSGDVAKNFGIVVNENMTTVEGRVIGAPALKLGGPKGNPCRITVHPEKCHWNLVGKSVVDGKQIERWALIDFSRSASASDKLYANQFINNLRERSRKLGMHMAEPVCRYDTDMNEFSSVNSIEGLLRNVVNKAQDKSRGRLQIIVCVMDGKHAGYKYLKWVSETKIGVVTQCCLSSLANKGGDQYLANLCLKINAKLGGSNVELNERLPHFMDEDCVMFIGADVNHPAARNSTCPSIAAVVGTVNWPAANRYVARVQPQHHRKEKILNFGSICQDLVNTYAQVNKIKPKKIVVFRDGVSEGQFDMVLNEELVDLKQAICDDHYQPTITLVVAQKRHQTRLFLEDVMNTSANVPPGTVVDTTIVHPFEFDFYLCSHHGSIGTSKPTHYCVLWDENSFTSDELQKLIYHLCFTYARCTKPVSLVPPVYYADLVAYRGRMFQEVVMELHSPAPPVSTSSASSSFLSSSAAASFQRDFYKLHSDLQNVMFFV